MGTSLDEISASVGTHEADVMAANNSVTVPMAHRADVRVGLQASAASVLEQDPVTYSLTVVNDGPSPAENVRVTLSHPAGQAETLPFRCVSEADGVVCNVGALSSGATRTFAMVLVFSQVGSRMTTAVVSSDGTDPDAANNTATAAVDVLSRPSTATGGRRGGGGALDWAFILLLMIFAGCSRSRAHALRSG
jgi:uncharacterized repeat protein (TIGR01451 family)